MDYRYKIVKFDEYCHKCKHKDVKETENPCNICLSIPVREATRMPEKFEEDKMAVVMGKRTMSLKQMRKHYKKIAYDLLYPEYVQDELDDAQTEEEMSNIMTTARKESMKYGRR